MPVDLYQDELSSLTDLDVYRAVEMFTRISEPLEVRPHENFVLDFKEKWNEKALHTVAAFAHTFGGLLLVGVSEISNQPEKLVGVDCRGELRTLIASSIATNISPTPFYEIAECGLQSDSAKRLAVVRVKAGTQLYYLTKKGEAPIYVRNESESRPADAGQLRSLIERKTSTREHLTETRLDELGASVNLAHSQVHRLTRKSRDLKIVVAPIGFPRLVLDSSIEQRFRKRLLSWMTFLFRQLQIERQEKRSQHFYEMRETNEREQRESVWRLTSNGDIVYATHAGVDTGKDICWSLGNTVVELWFALALCRTFWRDTTGFFGEAAVRISLYMQDFSFMVPPTFELWTSHEVSRAESYASDLEASIVFPPSPSSEPTSADGIFNSALPNSAVAELIAELTNQLLRNLGSSADLKMLRSAIRVLLNVEG